MLRSFWVSGRLYSRKPSPSHRYQASVRLGVPVSLRTVVSQARRSSCSRCSARAPKGELVSMKLMPVGDADRASVLPAACYVGPTMTPSTFLDLDRREGKPRERGLAHVMDKGLSLAQMDEHARSGRTVRRHRQAGLGDVLRHRQPGREARALPLHNVELVCGGTLLEVAELRGKLDAYRSWLSEQGSTCVEVSDGTIEMSRERKLGVVELFARAGCCPRSVEGRRPRRGDVRPVPVGGLRSRRSGPPVPGR